MTHIKPAPAQPSARRLCRRLSLLIVILVFAGGSACRHPTSHPPQPTFRALAERHPEAVAEAKERLKEIGGVR